MPSGASRIAVVGISLSPICGVRDHATLLARALEDEGVSCSMHWLSRAPGSLRADGLEIRAWTRTLSAGLQRDPPDAVLLHYSVFAYSHRGVPLLARPVLSTLSRLPAPLVALLHEFAYPWRRRGWRGAAWAITQRAALIDVVRACDAVIATADFQAEWIASRPWLPKRRLVVAPVFSNLPAVGGDSAGGSGGLDVPEGGHAFGDPADGWGRGAVGDPGGEAGGCPPAARSRAVVGLFGYAAEGAAVALTLDAVRLLEERGVPVRLTLLGAPGRQSSAGEMWSEAARVRGVPHALSFSGVLAPRALAEALATCDLLLFAETAGPTSRKTTLAASLASGRPVLAIDGPRRWSELVQAGAARIVEPAPNALASAIEATLADERLRGTLGARGRAFAEERMSAPGAARVVSGLLREILPQRGASPPAARHVEHAVS